MITVNVPNSQDMKGTVTITVTGQQYGCAVFYIDGVWKFTDCAQPWAWPFNTNSIPNGNHTLRVRRINSNVWYEDVSIPIKITNGVAVPPVGVKPVNTTPPVLTGTARQGSTLSCSTGVWSNVPTSYRYQWRRCDAAGANPVDISGAINATYQLTASELGKTLRCVVTAFNQYGATEVPVTTAQSAVVQAVVADTVAPSGFALSLGPKTDTTLVLNWTAATDNVGVDHYNVYRGTSQAVGTQVKIAEVGPAVLTYMFTGLTPNTDYSLGLEAVDAAGNKSALMQAIWFPVRTLAAAAPPPSGAVISNLDFDTGNTSQWSNPGFIHPERISIITADGAVLPRQGTHMARMELRQGDTPFWTDGANGVGLQAGYRLSPGMEAYMGWSLRLKSPFTVPAGIWLILQEWHGNDNFQAVFQQHIINGHWWFYNHWVPPGHVGGGVAAHDMGALSENVWWDFALRIKCAKDGTGIEEGWACPAGQVLANNKKYTRNGPTFYTSGTTYMYPQSVIYRKASTATLVAYYDEVKIGTTLASVTPV